MPIETTTASRPIPRPARGDNVRLIRMLFSDPPGARDDWITMILDRTDAAIDRLLTEFAGDGGATVDMNPIGRRLTLAAFVRRLRPPQMELTLTVANLAQRLDLTGIAADLPRPLGMIVDRPEGGAQRRVTRRREN